MAGVGNTNPTGANLPINNLINTGATNSTPAQTGSNSPLGETQFLQLLTTELQYQDPLNPMDSTQSITQLAQFQALSSQVSLASDFSNFQSNFAVMQAAGLVGKTASVVGTDASGNTSNFTGKISAIEVVNGTPNFTMTDANGNAIVDSKGNALLFQTNQITGLK